MIIKRAASINARHNTSLLRFVHEIRPQEGVDQAGETRRSTSRSAKPSSREINSLEKVKPGISPRFLSQKIEQKLPEKKIPYAQAKAMLLSAKV
ncbi:unnamed protein product [Brassica rapa]|uniref:Uncharacterized protein n=1 Tax=Brassica campestris TaxID=3711 RepID=A0A8D9DLL4_BRACM|nr:unnamed protein product [Brassica rapa]CAG7905972.1 unnamed protein product [Brassica rapa]